MLADHLDQAARDLEAAPDVAATLADGTVADASTDAASDDGMAADGDGDTVAAGLDAGLGAGLTEAHRHAAAVAGRNATRRAAALFELVTGWDHTTLEPSTTTVAAVVGRWRASRR